MTSVSRKDGFRYGFYIFAYWLVLLVVSGVLVAGGAYLVDLQPLGAVGANREGALVVLGGFAAFLGVLVFGSGQVGLVYKVVADGVDAGSGTRARTPVASAASPATPGTAEATGDSGEPTADETDRAPPDGQSDAEPASDLAGESGSGASETVTGTDDATGTTRGEPGPGTADDSGREPADDRASEAAGGQRTESPAGESRGPESPADVANESPIAEELGFGGEKRESDEDDEETPRWTTGENHVGAGGDEEG